MASQSAKAGSKRPRDPSTQGLKVKFLINIPVKVDSVKQAKETCTYLLKNLLKEGFKEKDQEFVKEGKDIWLENIAVIFGLNGKYKSGLDQVLEELRNFRCECKIKHSVITYTWGPGGTIAEDVPEAVIPYQDIREELKKHPDTVKLVEELRGGDDRCLIYFSFVDSDTFHFNFIYSEYLKMVRDELTKPSVPPTLMSTGYEFEHNSIHFIASWLDREVRAAVADVHPLLVYYPEPNFCVLLEEGCNSIKESFIKKGRTKNDHQKMESPVLIRQVKKRQNFKAVFPLSDNPIIIMAPERCKLKEKGLVTNQSHLDQRNLAIGMISNEVLTHAETYNKDEPNDSQLKRGCVWKNRGFIMELFNCKDDKEFEKLSKENPFKVDGKDATILIDAIKEAREYKRFIVDFNAKLPEDSL